MAFEAGSIIARMRMDAQGFKSAISGVKSELQGFTAFVEKNKQALQGLALGAGAAFAAITLELKKAVGASVEFRNAMMGLESIARGTGQNIDAAKEAAQRLAADGLMSVADAATGLKNLLATGFSLDQAITLMERFKDSAAFARQGSLSFGEAVRSATEGIKNGNSILVDNAGVTKNLSIMLEEAGYSAQDLSRASSDAGVRMAIFNGILRETQNQVGDAARLAESFGGSLARMEQSVTVLNKALGDAVSGPLGRILDIVQPLVDSLADWIEKNKALAGGLTLAAGALTGIVASLSAWVLVGPTVIKSVGLLGAALQALANPAVMIIAGFGLVAYAAIKNWDIVKAATKELVDSIKNFFSSLWENIKTRLEGIGKAAAALWQFIKDVFSKGPAEAWKTFVGQLGDISKAVAASNKEVKEAAGDLWKSYWDTTLFGKYAKEFAGRVKEQVSDLFKGFGQFFAPAETPPPTNPAGGRGGTGTTPGSKSTRNEALEKALQQFGEYRARLADEMKGLTGEALTNAIIASHQKQAEWLQKNILGVQGLIKTQEERNEIEGIIFAEMLARYEQIADRDKWTTEQRLRNLDAYVTAYANTLDALGRVDQIRQNLLSQLADEEARRKDQAYSKAMDLYRKETEGLKLSAEQRKKIFQEIMNANLPVALRSTEARKAIEMQLLLFDREIADERASIAKEQADLQFNLYIESLERQSKAKDAEIAKENQRYQDELVRAGNNQKLREQVEQGHKDRLQAIEDKYNKQRRDAEKKVQDEIYALTHSQLETTLKMLDDQERAEIEAAERIGQDTNAIRKKYDLLRTQAREKAAASEAILMTQFTADRLQAEGKAEEAELKAREARYLRDREQYKDNAEALKQIEEIYQADIMAIRKRYADQRAKIEKDAADKLALAQQSGLQAQLTALDQQMEKELEGVEKGSKAEADIRERYRIERERITKEWAQNSEIEQIQLQARLLEAQGNYEEAAIRQEEARWKAERVEAEKAGKDLETIDKIHQQNVLNIRQEFADKRLAIETKYREALEALGKTAREKELAEIDEAEKEALDEAKKAGADTSNITEYYRQLRLQVNKKYDDQEKWNLADMQAQLLEIQGQSYEAQIARENAAWERIKADTSLSQAELELAEKLHKARLAQIDKEAAEERIAIERQYHDLLTDLSLSREDQEIAALRRQREKAIEEATKRGAKTTDIEAYFDKLETQTRKRYADERAEFAQQYHDKVLSLSQSSLERELFNLDREREAALKQVREKITDAQELGRVEADINAYYNGLKAQATEEHNQKIADASKQLQIDLLRANGQAREAEIEAENLAYEQKLRNQELTDRDRETLAELHRKAIDEINRRYDEEERQTQAQLNIDYLRMKGNLLEAEIAEENERHRRLIESRKWTQAELEKLEEIHQAKIAEIRKKYEYQPGFWGRVTGGGFATPEERQRYEAGLDTKTGGNLKWMDQLKRAGELLVGSIVQQVQIIRDVIQAFLSGNWVGVIVQLVSSTKAFQRLMQVLAAVTKPFVDLLDMILLPIIRLIANIWNAIIRALAGINILGWRPFAFLERYLIDTSEWDREDQEAAQPGGSGKQGTQISEITGPTRDLLVSLLSPLKSLDILPGLFASMETAIYEMRDALLGRSIPIPATAGAGVRGDLFQIDTLVIEASVDNLSDLDKFMRLMGDKARLIVKGRGS